MTTTITPELARQILEARKIAREQNISSKPRTQVVTPELAGQILEARRIKAQQDESQGERSFLKKLAAGAQGVGTYMEDLPMKVARSLATGAAAVGDVAALPYNLVQAVRGKEGFSPSEKVKEAIDTATQGSYAPTSAPGRYLAAALEAGTGLGALSKTAAAGASKLASKRAAKGVTEPSRLEKIAKGTANVFEPTKSNVAGVVGASAGHELAKDSPNNGLAPSIALSLLGDITGRGIVRGGQHLGAAIRSGSTAQVALRDKEIGNKIEEGLADYLNLRQPIEEATDEIVGARLQDRTQKFKQAKQKKNQTEKGRITKAAEEHKVSVDLDDPLRFARDIYHSLEEPFLKKEFLKSPVGKLLKDVYGYGEKSRHFVIASRKDPTQQIFVQEGGKGVNDWMATAKLPRGFTRSKLNADQVFAHKLESGTLPAPGLSPKETEYFKEVVDNAIGPNAWNEVSTANKGHLKKIWTETQKKLLEETSKANPKLGAALRNFHKRYAEEAALLDPYIGKIMETRHKPVDAAQAIRQELGGGAYDARAAMKFMDDAASRDILSRNIIKELGYKDTKFDPATFVENYHNKVRESGRRAIKENLSRENSQKLDDLINMRRNLEMIRGRESIGDVLMQKQGLGLTHKALAYLKRANVKRRWGKPEEEAKLYELLRGAPTNIIQKAPQEAAGFTKRALVNSILEGTSNGAPPARTKEERGRRPRYDQQS